MSWRPALRIARRSVRRDLKRSILIAALIAVPIAGATVVDGLLRTLSSAEADAYRVMGDADGVAEVSTFASLPDWTPGASSYVESADERDPASVDLLGMLPPGSRIVPDSVEYGLRLRDGERIVRTDLGLFAVGDPLTDHRARLVSGRTPDGQDEAVVTEPLAERLGLLGDDGEVRRDATIAAETGPEIAVTGVAVNPTRLSKEAVFARPGSALAAHGAPYLPNPDPRFYVDLPPDADAQGIWPALAERGVAFTPRTFYLHPTPTAGGDVVETVGPIVLIVGFGLLEVMLLAGAAFAVGARRQVRELGLIGANGGTARQIRRTVLAQGLFLGTLGSLAGLALGWLVLAAGTPLWERFAEMLIEGWRFGWIELTVAAAVGLLSGLAAALLPAVGVARMRPLDALAQRFRSTALSARPPVLGMVLLGVGIVGVLASGVLAIRVVTDHSAKTTASGVYSEADVALPTIGVLLGGLAAVVGVIMVTSGLLTALARVGGRLPLSGRLAVRDAGRHRHRTVPAIAAIMIVVAGSVALAFGLAASVADDVRTQPVNSVMVQPDHLLDQSVVGDLLADGASDVADELPGAVPYEVTMVDVPSDLPKAASVSLATADTPACVYSSSWVPVGIGTPEVIELATGRRPDAAVMSAMADGEVVVLDECALSGGTAATVPPTEGAEPVRLPARLMEKEEGTFYDLPGAFVSAETAAAHGWTTRVATQVVIHDGTATRDDIDAALTAAEDHGLQAYVETDQSEEVNLISLALAAGAALITLLGVGITVALTAAEGRADLATLAAIGAQPWRRRTLAGAQALVISGLGTVLGLVIGGAIGFAAVPLAGETTIAMPWRHLAITTAVVPLLAVAVAMVSTRGNLPMVRRVE